MSYSGFEYCHERTFDPLKRLHASHGGRTLHFNATRGGGGGPAARPWLLHSNGKHFKLKDAALSEVMALHPPPPVSSELLSWPVLLVEGGGPGMLLTCEVATLGTLMNRTLDGPPSQR